MADKLGFDDEFRGKVSNQNNLEILFEKLSKETTKKYGIKTSSIFSMLEYKIRCACFHCDYAYVKENEKAYLKFSDGDKIYLGDLLKLTLNLIAKLNLITIVPYYFFKLMGLPNIYLLRQDFLLPKRRRSGMHGISKVDPTVKTKNH